MLGGFDLPPVCHVHRDRKIRNRPVVAARGTEFFATLRWNKPVANAVLRVGAKAVAFERDGQRAQTTIALLQSGDALLVRQIAETEPATLAAGVFKIKR